MFVSDFNKPLILQSDFSLLLDVHNPLFDEARGRLSAFAELEKSPEHIHTYRMSPLSLWNAASAGLTSESILETLSLYSRFPVPPSVRAYIESTVSKFGKIVLIDGGEGICSAAEPRIFETGADRYRLSDGRQSASR